MEINRKNMDILFRIFRLQFAAAFENVPAGWRLFCGAGTLPGEEAASPLPEGPGGLRRRFEETVAIPGNDIEAGLHGLYSLLIARMGCGAGRFLRSLAVDALLADPDGPGGDGICRDTSGSGLSAETFSAAVEEMRNRRDRSGKTLSAVPNLLVAGPSNKTAAGAILREYPGAEARRGNRGKRSIGLLILPELSGARGNRWFLCAAEKNVGPVFLRLSSAPELSRSDGGKPSPGMKFTYGISVRGEAFPASPHLIFRGGSDS